MKTYEYWYKIVCKIYNLSNLTNTYKFKDKVIARLLLYELCIKDGIEISNTQKNFITYQKYNNNINVDETLLKWTYNLYNRQ